MSFARLKITKAAKITVLPPFGGDKRVRTADLLNAIQALYQLSYTPVGRKASEYLDFYLLTCDCSRATPDRTLPTEPYHAQSRQLFQFSRIVGNCKVFLPFYADYFQLENFRVAYGLGLRLKKRPKARNRYVFRQSFSTIASPELPFAPVLYFRLRERIILFCVPQKAIRLHYRTLREPNPVPIPVFVQGNHHTEFFTSVEKTRGSYLRRAVIFLSGSPFRRPTAAPDRNCGILSPRTNTSTMQVYCI